MDCEGVHFCKRLHTLDTSTKKKLHLDSSSLGVVCSAKYNLKFNRMLSSKLAEIHAVLQVCIVTIILSIETLDVYSMNSNSCFSYR